MIRVAVDAMGGDNAPDEIVAGALEAASESIQPILCGPPGLDTSGLELIEAPQTIAMDEKPADAVREKPDSSLVACCRAVADGKADVALSAGNTGAMLAASLVYIRRLPGCAAPRSPSCSRARRGPSRPPRRRRERRGEARAPAPVRPDGRDLRRGDARRPAPQVRLLSIGEEPEKGSKLTLEAYELLAAAERPRLPRQRGEPRPPEGRADVDRHGRLHRQRRLKLLEGTIKTLLDALREEITSTTRGKLGGLLIRPAARGLRAPPRPGHVRRRVPARPAGTRVIAHGNSTRARDPNAIQPGRSRRRARRRRRLAGKRSEERVVASARFPAP